MSLGEPGVKQALDWILDQLRANLPDTHATATRLAAEWSTPAGRAAADKIYPGLKKISIDFAVMEKAPRVLVVEMALDWSDVGSFTALANVLPADPAGNIRAARRVTTLDVAYVKVSGSPEEPLHIYADEPERILGLTDSSGNPISLPSLVRNDLKFSFWLLMMAAKSGSSRFSVTMAGKVIAAAPRASAVSRATMPSRRARRRTSCR